MAITPRSFLLNPALLVAALAMLAGGLFLFSGRSTSSLDSWRPALAECTPTPAEPAQWSERAWVANIHCLMREDEGGEAYRAAREAVRYYPRSAALLNLKGFVAGRNGDHAVATHDFRTGLALTGSPQGVFENNIAWTMLWQLEPLEAERAGRVLRQARELYVRSLEKGWSCERVHTGMFVEYSIANHNARTSADGRQDPDVHEAVQRYKTLYAQYQPCERRLAGGDELVVEELLSAAVIDQEMGYIAGVRRPSRHLRVFDDAVGVGERLGLDVEAMCESSIPVADAVPACEALMR